MNIDYIICILLVIIIILLMLDKMNKHKESFSDKLFMSVDKNKGALNLILFINKTPHSNLYYYIDKNTNKLSRITSSEFSMYNNAILSNDLHVPSYTMTLDYPGKTDKIGFEKIVLGKYIVLNDDVSKETITNLLKNSIYDELSQNVLKYDVEGKIPIIYVKLFIRIEKPYDNKTLIEYINNSMESFQF